MGFLKRLYPFTAEQTVNILSEFGPLVTMFVVNAAAGIDAGTWALLISTVVAMVVMRLVLGRFPVFPIIASSVTLAFGALTLITGNPMWVQIKVSIFNALFAGFLFGGLWTSSPLIGRRSLLAVCSVLAIGLAGQIPYIDFHHLVLPRMGDEANPLTTNLVCLGSLLAGFLLGALTFRGNFFGHVFEKTFHFSNEGWDRFTFSFAWFFVFTAVMNEVIRQVFVAETYYDLPALGPTNGVGIWILFKVAFIMPVSGIYAWYLTRLMQKYRIDPAAPTGGAGPASGHVAAGTAAGAGAGQGYQMAQSRNTAPPTT